MKTILVDAADTFVVNGKIDEKLHQLLEKYTNRKIIVTNANDEQLIEYGIVNMPYEVFSLKHNPNKTDPEYFKRLFEIYNLNAEDLVYFEHNLESVNSAKSLGIASYFFDSAKRDLANLETFLNQSIGK